VRRVTLDRPQKQDWLKQARDLIEGRLADARVHAERGSLSAAHGRIDELADGLAELLGNARASFYWDAFRDIRPKLDPEMHRTDLAPDPDGERVARLAPVLGRDQAMDLAVKAEHAHKDLDTSAQGRMSRDLEVWEVQHRVALRGFAALALNDSKVAIKNVIERLHIKPELR